MGFIGAERPFGKNPNAVVDADCAGNAEDGCSSRITHYKEPIILEVKLVRLTEY